jgi:hypothetical protein
MQGVCLYHRGVASEILDHYEKLCVGLGTRDLLLERFDRGAHDPADLALAARFWHSRMVSEQRSIQVFAQLGVQLLEARASIDETTVMLRLAQDELRHTEFCAAMVGALGGDATLPHEPVRSLARHDGCSPEERALRNVLYTTCLSEMVALARLVDSLEQTTDETARAVLRAVLADEVLHGTFGFHYVESRREVIAADPDLRGSVETYLRHAFAVLERELLDPVRGAAPMSPGAVALGVIDPTRAGTVYVQTIESVVVPGLERHGLDAGTAYRSRALQQ